MGWPNASAPTMFPMFKRMIHVFVRYYPGRLKRFVLYPVPWILKPFVEMMRSLVPKTTAAKWVMLTGSGGHRSPCVKELQVYLSRDQLPLDAHPMHLDLPSNCQPAGDKSPEESVETNSGADSPRPPCSCNFDPESTPVRISAVVATKLIVCHI